MESSPYVDPTLELYPPARESRRASGIAIQAYLYRTAKDIESLIPLGAAIRIVKGAYLEPPDVAFPKKGDRTRTSSPVRAADVPGSAEGRRAAAHRHPRHRARRPTERLHPRVQVPPSAYEFAMLLRYPAPAAAAACREGKRLRVLISYGEYWFPWDMRRLAERPANVWFVVKNLGSQDANPTPRWSPCRRRSGRGRCRG